MSINSIKRVLIIQVTRIGDTLLTTPAIRVIAEYFPQADITVLAHPKRKELLFNNPYVQKIGSITKFSGFVKSVFNEKYYDLAFVYGFDKPLIKYALKAAKQVVAFEQPNTHLNDQLTIVVDPRDQNTVSAVDYLLRLPQSIGIDCFKSKRLIYAITQSEANFAYENLKALIEKNALLIGLQVASFPTKSYRDWPIEHFAQLINTLKSNYPNAHFLIFGGKAEYERTTWLTKQLNGSITNLAGTLTLRQTAACMSLLDLYIGIDTGPTHLMGCFDKPMVVLYHHAPDRLKPLEHPHLVVVAHPNAHLSGEHNMAEISVDEVLSACEKVLGTKKL
jgi:heptosyltransferase-3